jgi:hypothetical protein
MTYKGRPNFSNGDKRSKKLLRAARKYNRDNHTHFKHYNKRGKVIVTPFVVPMKKDTNHKKYSVFFQQKKDTIVSLIKRSTTVRELMVVINTDPQLGWLTRGMNGESSVDPHHYVSNILQKLVKDKRLLCVYERKPENNTKHSISHHWRYIRKDNHMMRTYYILEETRRGICHACVRIVNRCAGFINR